MQIAEYIIIKGGQIKTVYLDAITGVYVLVDEASSP